MQAPDYTSLVGTTINEQYHLTRLVATGAMGAVYQAQGPHGRLYAVKVFSETISAKYPEYTDHLMLLWRLLGETPRTGLLVPVTVGKIERLFYEVSDFVPKVETLANLINDADLLDIGKALKVIAKLARALHVLHAKAIVHADVKPSNVLITRDRSPDEPEILLTDFGMAQPVGIKDDVLIVGTYAYMHPSLRGSLKTKSYSTAARVTGKSSRVGPFIDIYSLGVVATQLLTGERDPEEYRDELEIETVLCANQQISTLAPPIKSRLLSWVSAMLRVTPSSTLSAEQIANEAENIAALVIPSTGHEKLSATQLRHPPDGSATETSETQQLLDQLRSVSNSLLELSTVFVSKSRELMAAPGFDEPERLLSDVSTAFGSALKRTKNVWIITVGMTVCIFALIVSMIVLAVGLALYTGKGHWTLVFGGASVPLILGTLLWRPFDRIFRATILTHQLEMVHVETVTSFAATRDYNERLSICRHAFEQLTMIFDKHSSLDASPKAKSRKRNPIKNRAEGGVRANY